MQSSSLARRGKVEHPQFLIWFDSRNGPANIVCSLASVNPDIQCPSKGKLLRDLDILFQFRVSPVPLLLSKSHRRDVQDGGRTWTLGMEIWMSVLQVVPWLSMQTHNTGVVTSIPPCVTIKTPLEGKAAGN